LTIKLRVSEAFDALRSEDNFHSGSRIQETEYRFQLVTCAYALHGVAFVTVVELVRTIHSHDFPYIITPCISSKFEELDIQLLKLIAHNLVKTPRPCVGKFRV
jgi:hypothetical protein